MSINTRRTVSFSFYGAIGGWIAGHALDNALIWVGSGIIIGIIISIATWGKIVDRYKEPKPNSITSNIIIRMFFCVVEIATIGVILGDTLDGEIGATVGGVIGIIVGIIMGAIDN